MNLINHALRFALKGTPGFLPSFPTYQENSAEVHGQRQRQLDGGEVVQQQILHQVDVTHGAVDERDQYLKAPKGYASK